MEIEDNKDERAYFPMYRSFVTLIRKMEGEHRQLQWYNYIFDYALFDKEPDFIDKNDEILFDAIKPNLDASLRHYRDGKKGGCPRGTQKPTMKGNKNASKKDSPSKEMPNNEEIKLKKIPKNVFK